jgi:flavin reductase (DIM6/NTAB) family NADH-FMN oxidoreductase RutF
VNQRLKDGGFSIAFDPIRCKFTPTKQMIDQCEAAGARLAQSITKAKDVQKQAMLDAEKNAGKEKLAAKSDAEMAAEKSLLAAFGNIINSSCMLTFSPAKEGEEGIRVPVSWVSQASFTPPGLMIAVEKRGLDAWLTQSPEEQLTELFKKYDKDGGGELDREEIDPLLTEMLGAEVGSAQEEMMKQKKEDAWKVLDIDGGGTVDMEEFIQAASEGPFAEMLDRERKMASLESIMGDDEDGALEFSLCMLPEGMKLEDAQKAPQHKKKKAKNGCTVIDGCTSFVECRVKSLVSAGTSSIIYAEVVQGDLVDESLRTELVRADHAAVEQVEGAEAAAAEEPVAA